MQKKEIAVFIDQITRERATGDLLIVGWAIDEVTKEIPTIKVEKENVIAEATHVVRLDINHLYNLDVKTQSGFKVRLSGKMRGKAILDFQTARHQNGIAVKLNGKYPYDDGIESSWERKKRLLKKGINYARTHGVKKAIRRVKLELKPGSIDYAEWISRHEKPDLKEQRKEVQGFAYRPLISILMPVYNVEIKWLEKCIDSVLDQTYDHWELCISDDASTDPAIQKCLEFYQAKDDRIKVVFRQENGHISLATNSALEMAEGEFIALLDNDDELPPFALYEVAKVLNVHPELDLIYSDEDKIDADGNRFDPHFKADWSPDTLMGNNYISHLGVYRTRIVKELGGFRKGYEGSQDYDLVLRVTEQIPAEHIYHIDRVLYHWRTIPGSTASNGEAKSYIYDSGVKALTDALSRRNIKGSVHPGRISGFYEITYDVLQEDLVSVIIPTKNGYEDLKTCVDSIIEKTSYPNYEIIIADNGSTDPKMQELFAEYKHQLKDRFIVELIDIPFNYSRINNLAAKKANGKYFLFLNNDTEVIEPDWMTAMVSYAQFDRIGCVGAKLFYPDDTTQHAGVLLGIGGVAGHALNNYDRTHCGYFGRLVIDVNYLAVTAACMMVKAIDFNAVNGFDETLEVAFNDVDLCLKVYELGRYNVYAHQAELYHFESKSRGYEDTPEKQRRFAGEIKKMQDKWPSYIAHDPFYNDNLTKEGIGDFSLRPD
ncbi:glycosyltransferase family 2 protein [Enterococcus faecium]|uniref:glycosyltransferase family 2 protein n=1 Tax=Enterococcus lactis TaxID=357441 RepID=UPI0019F69350|nr:glycosyltransferase family 2 protein [Enterococcus lactis]EGP5412917.1 glycosyltransferase family 2 protein [Enterococcus faecium]EME7169385.1 glycosyltransferase family 2 protein [Enterococcus faecium]